MPFYFLCDIPLKCNYLLCRIKNIPPGESAPSITLTGSSELPFCHFELDDTDVATAKGDGEQQRPLVESSAVEPRTRILKLTAVGIKKSVQRYETWLVQWSAIMQDINSRT